MSQILFSQNQLILISAFVCKSTDWRDKLSSGNNDAVTPAQCGNSNGHYQRSWFFFHYSHNACDFLNDFNVNSGTGFLPQI